MEFVCRLNLVLRILSFGRCFITIVEVGRAVFGTGPCYCLYGSCQVFLLLLKFNHFWWFCDSYCFLITSMVWSFWSPHVSLIQLLFNFTQLFQWSCNVQIELSCNGHEQWTSWQWWRRSAWTSLKNDRCLVKNID